MFKIGQKVVCKDNSSCPELTINKIYTITFIESCPHCGKAALELEEIGDKVINKTGWCFCSSCSNLHFTDQNKVAYFAYRFEPLKYDLLDNKDIISELIEERADIKIPELVEN